MSVREMPEALREEALTTEDDATSRWAASAPVGFANLIFLL
jgi:hypothetical protein